ncbi:MAG: PilN domain-containing protein [Oceanospirillaceae bacterium]|nr:PilN domain-containing protein [Oceanospirillaceae bacterium]MCP5350370.1 PilN domain-containing protein [Oceanospirillaceae bacterium]
MLQQVNFYTQEFHYKRAKFTAEHLWWTCLGSGLICTLWVLSQGLHYAAAYSQLDSLERELASAEEALDKTRQLFPAPVLNTQLQSELEQLKIRNEQQGGLFTYLSQRQEERDTRPYSAFLRGLSEVREAGLWLKQIKISEQGKALTLSGFTQRAEALPAYLKKLSQHPQFKGQGFALIDIHGQDAVYAFTVSSHYENDSPARAVDQLIPAH